MGIAGRRVSLLALVLTLSGACATGAEDDGLGFGAGPGPGGGTDDSEGAASTTGDGKPETTTDEDDGLDDAAVDDTSSGGGPSTTSGPGDDGSTGEPAGSSSDDGGSGPYACDNAVTCQTGEVLGGVSGDTGSPIIDHGGEEPTWVSFEVSEDNSDVVGEELTFTVTLTSPPDVDFDLYVYRGPEGGSTGCGGTPSQSTNAGLVDVVSMQWGEGALANNAEDGAWVAVEVRAKNGMCVPGSAWALTIEGDT